MAEKEFEIEFPECGGEVPSQDEEYCLVRLHGRTRRIRLHDYHEIYRIPGLYECLFCKRLQYRSPQVVASLLMGEIEKSGTGPEELSVLDIGAGNGLAVEALKERGVTSIVGMDIVPEALKAVRRDRPYVYDEYFVEDLEALSAKTLDKLKARRFNCLVSVGSLGFGDIHAPAFARAFNLIGDQGWIAFNIKEGFMEAGEASGFSRLVKDMIERGVLQETIRHRYCHRLSTDGREELFYLAIVGRKLSSVDISKL